MAAYRKISVTFWNDPYVISLTPEQKYFYLYLMTNPKTTQCGIYEISMQQMVNETGYNSETVTKLLKKFDSEKKIKYSKATNEIALKNWPKYNGSESPKVVACVNKELEQVKNRALIEYLYSMDTVSIEYPYSMDRESQESKEEAKAKTKSKAKGSATATVVDDLPFKSDDFYNAWTEWVQFRKEIKHSLTPSTIKKQLAFLTTHDERTAIAIINQSIEKGWQGLFDIKNKHGKTTPKGTAQDMANRHAIYDQMLGNKKSG